MLEFEDRLDGNSTLGNKLKSQSLFQRVTSFLFRSSKSFEDSIFSELNDPSKAASHLGQDLTERFDDSLKAVLEKQSLYTMPNMVNAERIIDKARDEYNIKQACNLIARPDPKIYTPKEREFLQLFLRDFNNSRPSFLQNLNAFDYKKHKVEKQDVDSLVVFATQVNKYYDSKEAYDSSILKLKRALVSISNEREILSGDQLTSTEYLNLVELVDDSIKYSGVEVEHVGRMLGELDLIYDTGDMPFAVFKKARAEAKRTMEKVDNEFQREAKKALKSGDMLQTIVDKEGKIIPGFHNSEGIFNKIYMTLKNMITKHGHSALVVYDKNDDKMHLSHITDHYRSNELKFHYLLYSDVYRIDMGNKADQSRYEKVQEGLYDAFSKHIISENSTSRKIMAGVYKGLYNMLGGVLKIFRKVQNVDDAIDRAYISKTGEKPKGSKENEMFCSEFVAESVNIAITQMKAEDQLSGESSKKPVKGVLLSDNAKELPPQEMIEKLEREKRVKRVVGDGKTDVKKIPMFHLIKLESERGSAHSEKGRGA